MKSNAAIKELMMEPESATFDEAISERKEYTTR
jgi:hypothetical protein